MITSGNPYRSPSIPPKPVVSAVTRVVRLRLLRFWQRRRRALLACGIALVVLPLVEALASQWHVEWKYLQQGLILFLFANVFRVLWIISLKCKTRPHVWTCRAETATVFVFLGFKVGLSYPCLCMTISGEPYLKDYLDRCVIFGTPLLITANFRMYSQVPNCGGHFRIPNCFLKSHSPSLRRLGPLSRHIVRYQRRRLSRFETRRSLLRCTSR